MTRAGAAHIYKRVKDKARIRKTGGVHTLRHACATGWLDAGVELPVIPRRFGHTSIRSLNGGENPDGWFQGIEIRESGLHNI